MLSILKNHKELSFALERSEAVYWGKLYNTDTELHPKKRHLQGAIACVLPEIDILAMNRVIGWGWSGQESVSELRDLIDFYRSQGCHRFFVQLSPLAPEHQTLTDILTECGFRVYNSWSKLWRPIVGYNPQVNTFFDIQTIGADQAEQYAQIIVQSFDWADARLVPWLAASVGQPGYRHYLVYHEGKAIAGGALHLWGEYASMAFAGTLSDFQGMGAQSLLIHHRIKDAYELGIRYLLVETAMDRPDRPVTSFRNMQRFGFDLAYHRENWIFEG